MTCLAPKKHIIERLTDWLTETLSRVTHIIRQLTDWLTDTLARVCDETHQRTTELPFG